MAKISLKPGKVTFGKRSVGKHSKKNNNKHSSPSSKYRGQGK